MVEEALVVEEPLAVEEPLVAEIRELDADEKHFICKIIYSNDQFVVKKINSECKNRESILPLEFLINCLTYYIKE